MIHIHCPGIIDKRWSGKMNNWRPVWLQEDKLSLKKTIKGRFRDLMLISIIRFQDRRSQLEQGTFVIMNNNFELFKVSNWWVQSQVFNVVMMTLSSSRNIVQITYFLQSLMSIKESSAVATQLSITLLKMWFPSLWNDCVTARKQRTLPRKSHDSLAYCWFPSLFPLL